jgi:hypothetical protein
MDTSARADLWSTSPEFYPADKLEYREVPEKQPSNSPWRTVAEQVSSSNWAHAIAVSALELSRRSLNRAFNFKIEPAFPLCTLGEFDGPDGDNLRALINALKTIF